MENEVKYKIKRAVYYFPTNRNKKNIEFDSLTPPYLSSRSSSRIIEFSNSSSKNIFKDKYRILTRNLNNFRRTKSHLINNKTEYQNFHKKILENKYKSNSIGSDLLITISNENKELVNFNNNIKTFSDEIMKEKFSKRYFFNLSKKTNIDNVYSSKKICNDIKEIYKNKIILNVQKRKREHSLEEYQNKSERLNMRLFQLKVSNNLINSYMKTNYNLLKFSTKQKEIEEIKLKEILIEKDILLEEIRKITEQLIKLEITKKFYLSLEELNKKYCGNTKDWITNNNFIKEAINKNTNNNLKLLEKLTDTKNELYKLKNIWDDLKKKEKKRIIENEEELKQKLNYLKDLKLKNYLLLKKKKYYLNNQKQLKKKGKTLNDFTSLNIEKIYEMNDELQYNYLINNSIQYYTLAKVLSHILLNIREKSPNFFIIPRKTKLKDIEKMLNMIYTENNKDEINKNILTMLLMLEKSLESIFIENKRLSLNQNNKILMKEELYKIEKTKESDNFKNYSVIAENIREKVIENIIRKENRLIIKPRKKINKYFIQKNSLNKKNIPNKIIKNQSNPIIIDYEALFENM